MDRAGRPEIARRRRVRGWVVVPLLLGLGSPRIGRAEPQGGDPPVRRSSPDAERDRLLRERDHDAWEARRLADRVGSEEAIGVARRMLATQRRLVGDSHPDVASALEFLAHIALGFARFEEARAALQEAMALRTKIQGADHWLTVDLRYALERARRLQGLDELHRRRYREAQRAFWRAGQLGKGYEQSRNSELTREALAMLGEAVGEAHSEYARSLERLANQTLLQAGVFSERSPERREAESLAARVLAIREQALGRRHPDYASGLEMLVRCLPTDGDPARTKGEPLLRQALEIRQATQGEHHPDYARALVRLAQVLEWKPAPDLVEAERLYRQAMEIEREAYGPDSLLRGNTLTYLARLYQDKIGDLDRAEPLLQEQVRIRRKDVAAIRWTDDGRWSTPWGAPPETEENRYSLLWVWYVRREILGSALGALARLYGRRGEPGRASRCLEDALDVFEEGFQYRAAALGARDYRSNYMSIYAQLFGTYLATSLDPRAEIEPRTAYRRVLAWKGAHFAAERRARSWRQQPELKPLYDELQAVSAAVARSTYPLPAETDTAAWDRLYAAMRRKEEVETELAGRVLKLSQGEARVVPDAEGFRAALPAGVALVDFLVVPTGLDLLGGHANPGLHLLAFVVRPDRPIVRLDLGLVATIERLVDTWRSQTQALADPARAIGPLRQILWRPLEPHLAGTRILLVSPDGPISRFPLAALPGRSPSTFLIEDLAIAVVPVPQLLVAESPTNPSTSRLLLIGDIDFGADPGPASSPMDSRARGAGVRGTGPSARRPAFQPLPDTRREIESIRDRFTAAHPGAASRVLRGAEATEAAFRSALPGSRYVHLATHGFFIPLPATPIREGAYWMSPQALAGHNPGLTSGITLAGVNRPPRPGREDGVLTAMEAQQLDLGGIELVVLSACETSLGITTKGEGMMGLQRAFQVAGAGSLISSLWSVDDAATSLIMEEFYTNLWERRLPKLEALRQAQLAVLRRYDPAQHRLRGVVEVEGPSPSVIAASPGPRPKPQPRTPPFFWAAFTLSGDWR